MSKVLLVEDDEFIIRLYTRALTLEGFEVQGADNGLSALEQLPTFRPDIILLDIMMPTMNGMEFLKKVSSGETGVTAPIIVLTNMSESSVSNAAVEAGAKLVLIKSQTEPDNVVQAINSVLAQQSQQQDAPAAQPRQTDADTPAEE